MIAGPLDAFNSFRDCPEPATPRCLARVHGKASSWTACAKRNSNQRLEAQIVRVRADEFILDEIFSETLKFKDTNGRGIKLNIGPLFPGNKPNDFAESESQTFSFELHQGSGNTHSAVRTRSYGMVWYGKPQNSGLGEPLKIAVRHLGCPVRSAALDFLEKQNIPFEIWMETTSVRELQKAASQGLVTPFPNFCLSGEMIERQSLVHKVLTLACRHKPFSIRLKYRGPIPSSAGLLLKNRFIDMLA